MSLRSVAVHKITVLAVALGVLLALVHSAESAPGPHDSRYLFASFASLMDGRK